MLVYGVVMESRYKPEDCSGVLEVAKREFVRISAEGSPKSHPPGG